MGKAGVGTPQKLDLVKELVLNRIRSAVNKEGVLKILMYLKEEAAKVKKFLMLTRFQFDYKKWLGMVNPALQRGKSV